MEEMLQQFTANTVRGALRGIVRIVPEDVLADRARVRGLALGFLRDYYNDAYRNLVLHAKGLAVEDDYYVNRFRPIHKVDGHSYICLLNISLTYSINFLDNILPIIELTSGVLTFESTFELGALLAHFPIPFSGHTCRGADLRSCDENEKIFHTR